MLGVIMGHYTELYRVEQLPVFQNRMFQTEKEARNCPKGDVILVQDLETGLIFNRAFTSELMHYDPSYHNEQAVSGVFQEHLNDVSKIILSHFYNHSLIEVGCGKGYFLELLQGLGFSITGLDPIYEGSNPSVLKRYFTTEVGLRADGIILRHVLEHVQDAVGFLTNIRDSNGGGGKIYIEVPCFNWICEHRAWFDIFFEHVNYYRISDLKQMFGKVFECGYLFNAQYIYIVADLSTVQKPDYTKSEKVDFPENFLYTVKQFAQKIQGEELCAPYKSAIWGGASKGVIFSLFMQRLGAFVKLIIDINTAKQGKYLPSTGLRVYSPEEAMRQMSPQSCIFIMNSNYLSEIKQITKNQFNCIAVDQEEI
jgi:hypothetical protein